MADDTTAPEHIETPPATEDQQRAEATAASLKELGIEPDEQGRIPLADHQKLLTTLSTLREQVKSHETAKRKSDAEAEKARVAALTEQEQALEAARKEGYEKATSEQRGLLLRTQVLAAATGAQFADPEDAVRYLDLDALTDEASVKAAVTELAKTKAYLLKAPGRPPIEQGPQSGRQQSASGGDWLFDELNKKRRGA